MIVSAICNIRTCDKEYFTQLVLNTTVLDCEQSHFFFSDQARKVTVKLCKCRVNEQGLERGGKSTSRATEIRGRRRLLTIYHSIRLRPQLESSPLQRGIPYQTPNTFSQQWIEIQQRTLPFLMSILFVRFLIVVRDRKQRRRRRKRNLNNYLRVF